MTTKNKEDETAKMANASETIKEDSSSEEENLDESKDLKVESTEDKASDYLDESKEPKGEVDYEKRYSDSTREYQKLKTDSDKLSLAMENLEKLAKINPQISAEIDKARKGESTNQDSSTLAQQQIDKALEPVNKIVKGFEERERKAKLGVLSSFEDKHPDLFSTKTTKKERSAIRQKIGKVARTLEETGMSYKQAVDRAYLTIDPKAAIQEGKDEAYLERLDANQAGFSSQSSTEGKKSGKPKYSQAQLEAGKKFGDKYYKSMIEENKK